MKDEEYIIDDFSKPLRDIVDAMEDERRSQWKIADTKTNTSWERQME